MNLIRKLILVVVISIITTFNLNAQKAVTGSVQDSDGNPLPGATIIEDGTNNGTVTDFDGNFSITTENNDSKLTISFIGYKTESFEITDLNILDAVLQIDSASLEEVLVVGYGTQKKSDLTGSVASVSSDEFEKAVFNDISQVLQGRSSGVMVTNTTAAPGTAPQIRIRGNNSINGSNDPLWVVDGVPLTQAPIFSPNEIQSFEILKDASATAIYGARGANGVVIVTTKSGIEGRTSFEIYSNRSLSNPINTFDVISDRNDYIGMVNEARLIQPGGAMAPLNPSSYPSNVTDWQDELLQPGERTEIGLNLSSGNEKIRISAAANILNDQGVIKNSAFKRGTLRLNTFFKASDWVSFDFKTSFSYSETENPNPLQGSRAGSTFSAAAGAPIILNQDYVGIGLDAFPFVSPLTSLENREFQTRRNNVLVSLNTTLNIIENLTFSNNTSVNLRSVNPRNYTRSAINMNLSNASIAEFKRNDFVSSNYFTYANDFDSLHDLTLTLGGETSWFNEIDFTSSGTDFPTDEFGPDNIGVASTQRVTSSRILSTLNSFFARANYVFDNKYLFNATFRADGSSRFATNNKWGYFPSFGAAYVISNEDFFESESINNLKIRTSWGQVGSQAISPYSSLLTFGTEFRTLDSTAPNGLIQSGVGNQVNFGISPTRVNNDDLRWETTTSFNIGLDASLFNNKVSFTADFYKKNTTDLLQTIIIPPQTGFSSALVNLGEIENQGFEFLINSDVIDKNNFSWSNSFNITFNRSRVIDLGNRDFVPGARVLPTEPSQPYVNIFVPGNDFGAFYGLVTQGLYQTADANPDGTTNLATLQGFFQPGWPRYNDLDDDGTITRTVSFGEDKTLIGNPNPDFIFGWNHDFVYKDFSLNLFFQGSVGNDIANLTNFQLGSGTQAHNGANQLVDYYNNRWTESNQHNDARYPRPGSALNILFSDAFVEDGTYFRLKNISLRYNLPVDNFQFLSAAEIYLTGTNIFTITNYSGLDPDVNTGIGFAGQLAPGVDAGGFPATSQYLVGLTLNF